MRKILVILLFFISSSYSQDVDLDCENYCAFSSKISFFTTNDEISTENKSDELNQFFILKITSPQKAEPMVIDAFMSEGSIIPQIQDVFSYATSSQKNIFVISKYKIYLPSIGTEGWGYTINSYFYDKNVFIRDEKFTLSGIEGLDEFQKVEFPYKTKDQVIEYINKQ